MFKVAIGILLSLKARLFGKSFEEILGVMGTVPGGAIFDEGIFEAMSSIKITNRGLMDLQAEYKKLANLEVDEAVLN